MQELLRVILPQYSYRIREEQIDLAEKLLDAITKDVDKRLYADLWSKGIPKLLTSGKLSIDGDFSAFKQSVGLNNKNIRLTEVTYDSPQRTTSYKHTGTFPDLGKAP